MFSPHVVRAIKSKWNKPWTKRKFASSDSKQEPESLRLYHYLQWHYAYVNSRYLQHDLKMYCWQKNNFWLYCLQIICRSWHYFLNTVRCLWVQQLKIKSAAMATQDHVVRIPGNKWKLPNSQFHIMVTTSQFFQKCVFYFQRLFLRTPTNHWAAAMRQTSAFCADTLIPSEPHVAIAPAALHNLLSKQSFAWSCCFLCWNIMCKVHIAAISAHVQYLCEKWVCKNISKILA